tara:strand:+ start:324 stop:500 length:177 start_codon:yes stop_codon:yes gene_type:complete
MQDLKKITKDDQPEKQLEMPKEANINKSSSQKEINAEQILKMRMKAATPTPPCAPCEN